ncbi:AAA family ATPase [Pectobacterium betavasculorum]|uniref:AAA family ATPase n=1 Tax=Pectobacterium betavasculorum TaxID=55207 RepID=UPI00313D7258
MELIYSYIHSCWGENFELGLNFTRKFSVNYSLNTRKINIERTQEIGLSNFFGSNISDVTAIVGRNGVGKSTLLNILGLQRLDHNDLYRNEEAVWFCLYHIKDDDFAIEGVSPKNFFSDGIHQVNEGYFAYSFKLSDDIIIYNNTLQEYSVDFHNSVSVLYNPNVNVRNRFDREYGNYGFKRAYINHKNSYVYLFLCDDKNVFELNKNNINFLLKVPANFKNTDTNSGVRLSVFNERNFYTADFIPVPGRKKTPRLENAKQNYILHLIESVINDYFLNTIKPTNLGVVDEPVDQQLVDKFLYKLNKKYTGDMLDYTSIKNYLIDVMQRFKKIAQEAIGIDEIIEWGDVVNYLEALPTEWFSRSGRYYMVSIPCTKLEFKPEIVDLMDEFDKPAFVTSVRLEQPTMSSGQQALVSKIASIHAEIKFQISNMGVKNIILLLDEYEEHLHPEWSRLFFSYLVNLLEEFKDSATTQIILATHSPYIISDLPKENVIKLTYDGESRTVDECHFAFGSNIYDIICDSFFLNNTMGEFARLKIDKMIKQLMSDESLSDIMHEQYQCLIDMIDDSYLRSHLQNMLDTKIPFAALRSQITTLEYRLAELNMRLSK